jgi:hypothetical protein
LEVFSHEVSDARVLCDGLIAAIGTLITGRWAFDGDVVNIGNSELGDLWLENETNVFMKDQNAVGPTHQKGDKSLGPIGRLEGHIVLGQLCNQALIITNIEIKHCTARPASKLLCDVFWERGDTGMSNGDGI